MVSEVKRQSQQSRLMEEIASLNWADLGRIIQGSLIKVDLLKYASLRKADKAETN